MVDPDGNLEPVVSKRPLPIEVRALRDLAIEEHKKRELELAGGVAAHVNAYEEAIERLIGIHAEIASESDIGLGTDTRWSAIWELAGRCLSECRLLLHALRGGFSVESAANERAIFEALYLLGAVTEDDDILRKWLAGEYVRPKTARAVMAKKQERARERMRAEGVPVEGDLVSSGNWIYDHFSQSAHHRRGPITRSISLERRSFAYGPHDDPRRRAQDVENAGHTIETALIVVADSLSYVVGRDDLQAFLGEQARELEAVRQSYPLIDAPAWETGVGP